jgi:hypothetical protein
MKMNPIRDPIANAAAAGLKAGGREVLKVARERTPVDDGELRQSGRVVADDLDVLVKFTAPHAWLQHEKLEYQHPNGGQAKYLESAALESDIARPIAERVRAVLGGG